MSDVETMMVSKSWSVGFSRPNHRTNTATRSGFGRASPRFAPEPDLPCVVHSRSFGPPGARIESVIPRDPGMDSYPRAAAVARATSRAAYLNINAGRPATPEHETQRAVTRRSAYYTPCRPLASRASPSGSQPARGAAGALTRWSTGVRTPIRGSGTHSFLDSSHVRSVTASYCHSPTTAGRLSR